MRQEAPFFEGRDAQLVFIAKRMSDATDVEALLTQADIEYGVEADTYTGGFLFRAERVGAFFYVLAEAADSARLVLKNSGWKPQS